jgi:hypothetical protein
MTDAHRGVKVLLQELPKVDGIEPETSLTEKEGTLSLWYEFHPRDGASVYGGIRFEKTRSYRFAAESHCDEWQIGGVYDRLVEIQDSPWIEALNRSRVLDKREPWPIRHYMIYVGDDGCYEVAAERWSMVAGARDA